MSQNKKSSLLQTGGTRNYIDIFTEIKSRLHILDVANRYGIVVNRHGFACCPFHNERTPSFRIYQDTGRFHCYGCGATGDVITLVQQIRGLPSPLEAAKLLNEHYGLGLFGKVLSDRERRQAHEVTRQREQDKARLGSFEQWETWACRTVAEYLRLLNSYRSDYKPDPADAKLHPLFVEALHNYDRWDYLYMTVFIHGDFAIKAEFYKNNREEVVDLDKNLDAGGKNKTA